MKGKIIKIICALLAFILTVVIVFVLIMFVFPLKYKEPLNYYSTGSAGGMTGGRDYKTIRTYNETQCIYSHTSQEWHNSIPETKELLVDKAVLEEIEEVFYRYRMRGWDKLPQSGIVVYDGTTTSYSMYFGEETWSYYTDQITPFNYAKARNEIDDIVDKYVQNGTPIPTLVKDWEFEEEDALFDPPSDSVSGKIIGYSEKTLTVRIYNGTDKQAECANAYRLYQSNPQETLLEKDGTYKMHISSNSFQDIEIYLSDYLEQGEYILEVDDIIIPFQIQ